jgi:predicted nucleic acid-binding protein
MQSAFERLKRMGQLSSQGYSAAIRTLDKMRRIWTEVNPIPQVRSTAETLLSQFPLHAADALQLAAAVTWSTGFPKNRVFISSDTQLLHAAQQLGFQTISA